jgi:hypothetical protein
VFSLFLVTVRTSCRVQNVDRCKWQCTLTLSCMHSSADTVTALQAVQKSSFVSLQGPNIISSLQRALRLWDSPGQVAKGYRWRFSRGWSGGSMRLITYFHLVPSLGIREPVPPYPYLYPWCCVLLRTETTWPELPSPAFGRAYAPNSCDYTHNKRVGRVAEQFG